MPLEMETEALPRPRELVPLIIIDEASGGSKWLVGRTKLTKMVFLAQKEAAPAFYMLAGPDEAYEFVPYHYGPFSSELLRDLEDLEQRGLIEISRRMLDSKGRAFEYLYQSTGLGRGVSWATHSTEAMWEIRTLAKKYAGVDRNRLVRYIYQRYPEAVRPAV